MEATAAKMVIQELGSASSLWGHQEEVAWISSDVPGRVQSVPICVSHPQT